MIITKISLSSDSIFLFQNEKKKKNFTTSKHLFLNLDDYSHNTASKILLFFHIID